MVQAVHPLQPITFPFPAAHHVNHDDSTWTRHLTTADTVSSSTQGSVLRSTTRLLVAQPPTADELCAFGHALPVSLRTIIITGRKRRSRAHRSAVAACLPNVAVVEGYAPFASEADVPPEDRTKFGNGTFAALSLGEIAIHLSHRRALEQCLRLSPGPSRASGCLIMEDDFTLSGPSLAQRWNSSYTALLQEPEWHLLFVGRCLDARCGRDDLRVSTHADLYRTPKRTAPMGQYGWQYATPMCLHSYMVSHEGASRMLTALSSCPGLCPVDWAPAAMADRSAIFTISPALFTQVRC